MGIHNKSTIKVGLVQPNVGFTDGERYLPLSVAYLQMHAQGHLKRPEDFEFFLPVYRRENIEECSEKLSEAGVVAYSHYTWNANYNLALAKRVKERNPSIINIFGGPHVPGVIERQRQIDGKPAFEKTADGRTKPIMDRFPERVEVWHKKHPYIDMACHGEGEEVFTRLLAKINKENPLSGLVPSLSYLDRDGQLITTPKISRINDLDIIPSPYLMGFFDKLMDKHPDQEWINTYETNRGCPFSCSWCDWGSATSVKISKFDLNRIFHELDWQGEHKISVVWVADANFGLLDRDLEIAKYIAGVRRRTGFPHRFTVQNSKNRQEACYEVQKVLFEAGLANAVVSALQSVNPDTLRAIKRINISQKAYLENQQRLAKLGMETMTELIWPQPLETYESYVNGICSIIANGQHSRIQMNKLSILPNPELGDPEEHKKYGIKIVECPVANMFGNITAEDDIVETQELVVATSTCSQDDYVRGLTFAWTVGLFHFNKLVQIPIVLMREHFGVDYRELFDLFADGTFEKLTSDLPADKQQKFPVIAEIRKLFMDKGFAITQGDYEFCGSPELLNIWWQPEVFVFIKLYAEHKLDQFYREAQEAFELLLQRKSMPYEPELLHQAFWLNRQLLKLPNQRSDINIKVDWNIWEFYRGVITGERIPLVRIPTTHNIDRSSEHWSSLDEWCRKVIYWYHKKAAYLYATKITDSVSN